MMDDKKARIRVTAERSFLKELEGGCQIPIAAYCYVENDKILLEGMVGSIDGKIILREKKNSDISNAEGCGKELAELLKERGAAAIIDEVRDNVK
jgi:hydroxymethylbilane synthase